MLVHTYYIADVTTWDEPDVPLALGGQSFNLVFVYCMAQSLVFYNHSIKRNPRVPS